MKVLSTCLAAVLGASLGEALALANINPTVTLSYATYKGKVDPTAGFTGYYGINYAAAPTGTLRWKAPVAIESALPSGASTVQDATAPGPTCFQGYPAWQTSSGTANNAEDCLILDVLVPPNPQSSSLPVIFQIHGGGYAQGSTSYPYSGQHLVSVSNGAVIYVAIQYRLGGLGFLAGSEISADGSANVGLLDQNAALEWVQRNIASFGGDPTQVTIFGGSAGGGSVTSQLIMNGGRQNPPFRAAIAQYPWWQPYHTEDVVEDQYQQLLTASGCGDLDCLRNLPFTTLTAAIQTTYTTAYNAGSYGYGDYYYGPIVDGTIIQDLPSAEFPAGHFSKVPLLTDREALEGLVFSNFSISTEDEANADLEQLWPAGDSSFFSQLYSLYPTSLIEDIINNTFVSEIFSNSLINTVLEVLGIVDYVFTGTLPAELFFQVQTIFGDAFINCATLTVAQSYVSQDVPVWKMIFNSGVLVHGSVDIQANTSYSGTILPGLSEALSAPNQEQNLDDYYLSFATSLDPNVGVYSGIPRAYWPQYGSGSSVLEIDRTGSSIIADLDNNDQCAFFQSNGNIIRN